MKKIVGFLAACLMAMIPLFAQEQEGLTIVSFAEETGSKIALASVHKRLDANDVPAALVLAEVLTKDEVAFRSPMVLDDSVKHEVNTYWVYLCAGAKSMDISHPMFETLHVDFEKASGGAIRTLKSMVTYRLVVSVPKSAESFDDILATAKDLYAKRGTFADPEQYRKGVLLYENAMKHTDCPPHTLSTLQTEMDEMKYYRKFTYLYKRAQECAAIKEAKDTYDEDSACIYRQRAYKSALKLEQKNPNSKVFKEMKNTALKDWQKLPCGQQTSKTTVTKTRTKVFGKVTISVSYAQVVGIYAGKEEKAKQNEKISLGNVNADGTYEVVLPDGYHYISFDFIKKPYYIPTDKPRYELNVEIK